MNCPRCGGKGVSRVGYQNGDPTDYVICLCTAGLALRNDRNGNHRTDYPLWMAWAARERVPFEQVVMAEDVLDADELVAIPRPGSLPSRSIADAMRTKKGRL